MKNCKLFAIVVAAGLLGTAGTASAEAFKGMVSMGDSLSDPGNAFVLTGEVETQPYQVIPGAAYSIGGHHFSNGATWVEQLGQELGLQRSTGPRFRRPGVFTNYSVGGSRARGGAGDPVPASAQVGLFLLDFGFQAPSDLLYTFTFGGNDIRDALEVFNPLNPIPSLGILDAAADAIRDNLLVLCGAGARQIIVGNMPNLGVVPAIQGIPGGPGAATFLSSQANLRLANRLATVSALCPAGTQLHVLDIFARQTLIAADPEAFGFVDATPCLVFGVAGNAICRRPNSKFYWDGIHPTKAGHQIFAEDAAALLTGP